MKKLTLFVFHLGLIFYAYGSEYMVRVTDLLSGLEKTYNDGPKEYVLLSATGFSELRDLADKIIVNAVSDYLENDSVNSQQKKILILSMQSADFNKYKQFLLDLSIAYSEGLIVDELVVLEAYYGHFLPNDNTIYRNYRDKVIRQSIRNCLKNKNTSEMMKKSLMYTYRGKKYRDYLIRKWGSTEKIGFPPGQLVVEYFLLWLPYLLSIAIILIVIVLVVKKNR